MPESEAKSPRIFVSAFLCQDIIREKNDILTAVRIMNAFSVEPTFFTLLAADGTKTTRSGFPVIDFFACLSFHTDQRAEFDVRIKGISPSGTELLPSSPPVRCIVEGGAAGHALTVASKLATDVEGDYWIEVYINDNLETKMPMRIIHRQLQGLPESQSPVRQSPDPSDA